MHLITGMVPFLDRVMITLKHSEAENKTLSTVCYKVKELKTINPKQKLTS